MGMMMMNMLMMVVIVIVSGKVDVSGNDVCEVGGGLRIGSQWW